MTTYTLKFYKGRRLIVETSWDANESTVEDMTHDAEQLIEEAVECNPPEPQKVQAK